MIGPLYFDFVDDIAEIKSNINKIKSTWPQSLQACEKTLLLLKDKYDMWKSARPIFFPYDSDLPNLRGAGEVPATDYGKEVKLDLPFETVWIEYLEKDASIFGLQPEGESENKFNVHAIICRETSPGEYAFVLEGQPRKEHNRIQKIGSLHSKVKTHSEMVSWQKAFDKNWIEYVHKRTWMVDPGSQDYIALNNIVANALKYMNKHKAVSCSYKRKIKTKSIDKENKFVKTNDVILCGKKEYYEKTEGFWNEHNVNWSHRWEVRGHWRTCQGLGKDREGNRVVSGHTWVVPHIKGEGEFIKKSRVFTNEARV